MTVVKLWRFHGIVWMLSVMSPSSFAQCIHTQTQDSVHVTKAGSDRQWNCGGGERKLVSRQILVVLLFRFGKTNFTWSQEQWEPATWHGFTSWPEAHYMGGKQCETRTVSETLLFVIPHMDRDLLSYTAQSHRKRNAHKNIPRHLQKMTQKKTSQAASVCDFFSYW